MIRGLLLAFLVLCGAALPAVAQIPTSDQLELLRSLSPEDREALMRQLGLGGAGDDLSSGLSDLQVGEQRRRTEDQLLPRDLARMQGLDAAQLAALDRKLKPEDTVLIEIGFIKDKPPRTEVQAQGMPPVTIPGEPAPVLTEEEKAPLQVLIDLIRLKNPYQLDASGALLMPGFAPITLAGLDDEQATKRLAAVPALRLLDVKVTKLPVRKQGFAALKPFGYDLFSERMSTFAPVTDVPVPSDYLVGAGDQLNVQLYGSQNRNLKLTVGRDGRVSIPEIGPINVGGRTFTAVREDIEQRIAGQMVGVRGSVSMGDTRSIRVFVLGEVNRPGTYIVSGLASISSALYASGGIKPIGSLRDVQLKRQGTIVRRLDLYDMLIHGDTGDDAKLLPGDVIFIPPVGPTVAVDGEVKRPAIYELKGNTSLADLLALAGGVTAEADTSRAAIVRVNEQKARVVVNASLEDSGKMEWLRNGDAVRVLRLTPTLDSGVVLEGHVFRPGPVAWREGLRLTNVIGSVDELKPNADLNYILIRRELPPDRRAEILSADLTAALQSPGSSADLELQPRDRLIVFDRESGRAQYLNPLLEDLKRQATIDHPSELVRIDGRVKERGDYPLEPDMRVSDLLRAGGGLEDAAYASRAELTRFRVGEDGRETQLIDVDLAAIRRGDREADIALHPFDFLNILEMPEWSMQERVTVSGEVRFPGTYPIKRGETLRSVLERAGGLSPLAFPVGAVFTRKELLQREQEQMSRLADRLQSDLASAALQGAQANHGEAGQALSVGQSLLNQLRMAKPVGRLVIDVNGVLEHPVGSAYDVVLRDGDTLQIPKHKQEVTVIGEVQGTTSHFYRPNLSRDDYIAMSGGLTRKADRGRIYIVRADGSVVSSEGSGWFRRSGQVAMRAGDTVVVPLDTERMPPLPLWQAVTQIIYNLAIAAAAVNSF